MRQGIQTDFPHEALQKFGCYFFCLAEWAERESCRTFDTSDMIDFFKLGKNRELLNKNVFIFSPAQLLNLMVGHNRFSRILITDKAPSQDRYIVYLEKPGFGHFVLHDKGDLWDPLDPRRPGAAGYKPVSYRKIL